MSIQSARRLRAEIENGVGPCPDCKDRVLWLEAVVYADGTPHETHRVEPRPGPCEACGRERDTTAITEVICSTREEAQAELARLKAVPER